MSSLVYIGIPPRAGQVVSDSIRDKGLELIRAAPSDFNTNCWVEDTFPSHAMYLRNIHQFIEVAKSGRSRYIRLANDNFEQMDWKGLPESCKTPLVAFSFNTKVKEEKWQELKERYGARDTVMKGKPALLARLSTAQVKRICDEENPITTTPTNETCININAYRGYLSFHRIFDAICRVNQYPCHNPTNTDEEYEGSRRRVVVNNTAGTEQFELDPDEIDAE